MLSKAWEPGAQEVTFVLIVKEVAAERVPRRASAVPGEPTG